MQPIFSIGVTTYNRRKFLKECLDSILSQSYSNFEVIVGNDYIEDKLYLEEFDIDDPRIRIANHEQNVGEIKNMNWLLNEAQGRYFTWLADDDMYMPGFLESVFLKIQESEDLQCVFTSYYMGNQYPKDLCNDVKKGEVYDGKYFLKKYLDRTFSLQGCYGVFERNYISSIGGMKPLNEIGFSPGSDNLIGIKTGLLKKVGYIDAPLIFYRAHSDSMSLVSTDFTAYYTAEREMVAESIKVFSNKKLIPDFDNNLFLLLKWILAGHLSLLKRSNKLEIKRLIEYMIFIIKHISILRNNRCHMIIFTIKSLIRYFIPAKIKNKQ